MAVTMAQIDDLRATAAALAYRIRGCRVIEPCSGCVANRALISQIQAMIDDMLAEWKRQGYREINDGVERRAPEYLVCPLCRRLIETSDATVGLDATGTDSKRWAHRQCAENARSVQGVKNSYGYVKPAPLAWTPPAPAARSATRELLDMLTNGALSKLIRLVSAEVIGYPGPGWPRSSKIGALKDALRALGEKID
jgi:hypothetical protein